jgi:hypothetical protein
MLISSPAGDPVRVEAVLASEFSQEAKAAQLQASPRRAPVMDLAAAKGSGPLASIRRGTMGYRPRCDPPNTPSAQRRVDRSRRAPVHALAAPGLSGVPIPGTSRPVSTPCTSIPTLQGLCQPCSTRSRMPKGPTGPYDGGRTLETCSACPSSGRRRLEYGPHVLAARPSRMGAIRCPNITR